MLGKRVEAAQAVHTVQFLLAPPQLQPAHWLWKTARETTCYDDLRVNLDATQEDMKKHLEVTGLEELPW